MSIRVAARFNGPPGCGNGGYTAGLIAGAIGSPVRVRLLRPVPLDEEMTITAAGDGRWDVRGAQDAIATAVSHQVSVEPPPPPSRVEAIGASQHYAGFAQHGFPRCFVCGPEREPGDGLRVFAGSVPGLDQLAAPWRPDASLADSNGKLRGEFLWAALDCPGYFATCNPAVALLGELSVRVDHIPAIDEPCMITAWRLGSEGRKHRAGTALFDSNDTLCALGVATWVELKS